MWVFHVDYPIWHVLLSTGQRHRGVRQRNQFMYYYFFAIGRYTQVRSSRRVVIGRSVHYPLMWVFHVDYPKSYSDGFDEPIKRCVLQLSNPISKTAKTSMKAFFTLTVSLLLALQAREIVVAQVPAASLDKRSTSKTCTSLVLLLCQAITNQPLK
jgi:hypothetical protein